MNLLNGRFDFFLLIAPSLISFQKKGLFHLFHLHSVNIGITDISFMIKIFKPVTLFLYDMYV